YADHQATATTLSKDAIITYLKDGGGDLETGYDATGDDKAWNATYELQGTTAEKTSIKKKLEARASQVGITVSGDVGSKVTVTMFIR
ncbi:MAG: hypothetical protein IJJ09_02145, partial [Synergistaceae bacterium]|nr:hypothetical protein [Synergistaceae bacterium]